MELRQIRYAAAVAEHGTVRSAARQLHIAPQSLAQQLDVLERELDTPLFRRHRTGMALTAAGEVFVAQAAIVLAAADSLMSATRRAAAEQAPAPLRIAVASSLSGVFAEVLRSFLTRDPAVDVRLTVMRSADQLDALRRGDIAAGVGHLPRSPRQLAGLRAHPLAVIEVQALVRRDDPLCTRIPVAMATLALRPLLLPGDADASAMRSHLLAAFTRRGLDPVMGPPVSGHDMAIASVAAGRGYALCVPADTPVDAELAFVPLAERVAPLRVVLLVPRDAESSHELRGLISATREVAEKRGRRA